MNRRLDGVLLTIEDMTVIALEHELISEETLGNHISAIHNAPGIASFLSSLTAKTRRAMFMRGELRLDTRTPANSPGFKEPS